MIFLLNFQALPSAPGAINFPLQEFVHTAEMQLSGRSAEDVTDLSVLQQTFGYERFRPGQEEGVNALLQGKDCIILIPTGGGKTIIYSIPTLMMNGISVVISPLLMLMHDQVLRLREKAINTTYINSLMTATEREQVIGNLARPDSEYKVLICGPENYIVR